MRDNSDHAQVSGAIEPPVQLGPAFLVYFHIALCCLSLVYVSEFYGTLLKIAANNEATLYVAAANVAPFALVSIFFTLSRFSFGYFLGFYFYTLILGYLWLVEFSKFSYDHVLAAASAFASALAFLIPALFIVAPIRQRFVLSAQALDRLLTAILLLAAAVIGIGAIYNFRLVGLSEIYEFRSGLEFPTWLMYGMGVTSNALLPFAFACFVVRGNRWRAALSLVLLLLFYPVTLSKLALFAPFWLLFLMALSWLFPARTVVVLSLFIPTSIGVLLALLFDSHTLTFEQITSYFGTVNFRMIALPSSALDFYNDFFSSHELTHFCQINVLKPFVDCPYREPLAVVMQETYRIGNFNASLFATEGIASVGPVLAPLAVLACSLVISIGNRLSAGLPSSFILLSGGMLPQTFLNISLTIVLVTNGAAVLFLLWYVTPRSMFENEASR
jgi:hypothetical protein